MAGALTSLRPDVLVIDFENLYPDGSVGPSGGARYLRGSAAEPPLGGEAGTLSDHPALIHLTMTAWSKVFRRDFLAGLGVSFGPAPHEDVPVTTLALLAAGRIGVLDRVCYRYRRSRRGSYLAAVSDANFKNMVDRFGERGVVETVGTMGHFHTLTMLFVVDRYPVPAGAPDEIKAPR